ncbi:MAG: DUF6807 family protein [Prolixibacteraceae bacterium]
MMTRIAGLLLCIFIFSSADAQKMHLKKEKNGYWILENNERIFFFQRSINDSIPEYARNNYLHPVYDLNGNCITEDYPEDHLHHRGIFWAWHQLLVDGEPICDGWDIKNFSQNISQFEFTSDKEKNGVISYTSFWHTDTLPDDPFLMEKTKVIVHPRTRTYRRLDFEISLRALENKLSIGGSNDQKGYSGFSVRLKTDEKTRFTGAENEVITPTNLAIPGGERIDIYQPDMKSGLTIIPWPQNPGSENQWLLRQTRSMQNCAWPGRIPVPLSIENPTVLRYTLIIHNGKIKKKILDQLFLQIEKE